MAAFFIAFASNPPVTNTATTAASVPVPMDPAIRVCPVTAKIVTEISIANSVTTLVRPPQDRSISKFDLLHLRSQYPQTRSYFSLNPQCFITSV